MRARKRTRLGAMRQLVDIHSPPTGRDALGQVTGDWTVTASDIPARYEQLSGLELERARQKYDQADYAVEIYRPTSFTVTAAMRVVTTTAMSTRTLEIGHVGEGDDTLFKLVLLCKDVTSA